jgi:BioD-like phosphotransacetylase family protein
MRAGFLKGAQIAAIGHTAFDLRVGFLVGQNFGFAALFLLKSERVSAAQVIQVIQVKLSVRGLQGNFRSKV